VRVVHDDDRVLGEALVEGASVPLMKRTAWGPAPKRRVASSSAAAISGRNAIPR
jgi:hypothetical protein